MYSGLPNILAGFVLNWDMRITIAFVCTANGAKRFVSILRNTAGDVFVLMFESTYPASCSSFGENELVLSMTTINLPSGFNFLRNFIQSSTRVNRYSAGSTSPSLSFCLSFLLSLNSPYAGENNATVLEC